MTAEIPELSESSSAPPSRGRIRSGLRFGLVAVSLLLAVTWWQRERISQFLANQSPAHRELRNQLDQLAAEREALAAEISALKDSEVGVDSAVEQAFANTQLLAGEIDALNDQVDALTGENASLQEALGAQERRAGREIQNLESKISRLEDLARSEREKWQSEEARLVAANENLEKQNALLKDRLSETLMASVETGDLPNAAAALGRGSLRIESLEKRIIALETQLAESGEQRNLLARSLRDSRDERAAANLTTELSASAGDRMMADLSERFAALKRNAESTLAEREKERSAWNKERFELVASRDALRADVLRLRQELDSLKKSGFAAEPVVGSRSAEQPAETADPADAPSTTGNTPVLIEDPEALSQAARPLFENLRGLDETTSELSEAYRSIGEQTGGQLAITIPFSAGSATIASKAREDIRALVSASPSSRFLAIGYASTDGDRERNRALSSRRALATAEAIAEAQPSQPVEAVYFGQTKRFDPDRRSSNRVVEIWKIDGSP